MKTYITGGTGFIGSRLALACLDRGDQVLVLGQKNTPAESANADLIEHRGARVHIGSVTDPKSIDESLVDMDVVFHLAATQHEMNVPDEKFWNVNVTGTQNVFDAAKRAGVKRFVHGSTIGVYGIPESTLDEKTPCNPDNIYGVTKLKGEELVLSRNDEIPVAVIRIPEIYGPGDTRLVKLFKAIKSGRFFRIGNGKNLHHLLYVDDLVQGLILAAEHPDAVGQRFLYAGRSPVSTDEMINSIAEQVGVKPPRLRIPLLPFTVVATLMELTMRPLGIQPPLHRRRLDFFKKSFTLSSERAQKTLGFDPQIDFDEGAKRTAAYYLETGRI